MQTGAAFYEKGLTPVFMTQVVVTKAVPIRRPAQFAKNLDDFLTQ